MLLSASTLLNTESRCDICPSGASGSLSLVLDDALLATSDSSPRTSSRPFVTNYTSLGFHLSENGAFFSLVEGHGCSQTGSSRLVTMSLMKCVFVRPSFYRISLSGSVKPDAVFHYVALIQTQTSPEVDADARVLWGPHAT